VTVLFNQELVSLGVSTIREAAPNTIRIYASSVPFVDNNQTCFVIEPTWGGRVQKSGLIQR
jgi:hypothetical protein